MGGYWRCNASWNYLCANGLGSGLTETFGGLLILLGLAFRPACILLIFNLLVAFFMRLKSGEDFMAASQVIKTGFMFLGLIFIEPGKYSVDIRNKLF